MEQRMVKRSIADSVNYWKEYEKTKNKEFIDFSKNPKKQKEFFNLVLAIKKRSCDATS
jgi:hypothetical protein